MKYQRERINRAQRLMKEHGILALMLMNRDDFRYFFGEIRVQPRAIIPAQGTPQVICFHAEESEIREQLPEVGVLSFRHVGEQMSAVSKTFRSLAKELHPVGDADPEDKPRIGMQLWFSTPAFLVDLFRKLNPGIELVSSDPVMDPLRMIKAPEEIDRLRRAQEIAGLGMDRIRSLLVPGVTGLDLAAEATCTMLKAGASGTSTPIHINIGLQTCWIHGKADRTVVKAGDLVVVDFTPRFDGYCANLARTFVVGRPNPRQQELIDAYLEMREVTREALQPGAAVSRLDKLGKEVCERHGLGEHHINGIAHGIGLRFEETPASTIIPQHRTVKIQENMTMTIGHTVLAVPGYGGVRFEDIYRVTPEGGELLTKYPAEVGV
jgi:Xaa-Pro aminopeptidase